MGLPHEFSNRDENGLLRAAYNPLNKTIANGTATALFNAYCIAGAVAGGAIFYEVYATDGTDYQGLTGMVTYAAVNKASTLTMTITEVTGNQAKAVSAGTLTLAWTIAANSANTAAIIKLQPTTSLTATTHTVKYTVFPIHGRIDIV